MHDIDRLNATVMKQFGFTVWLIPKQLNESQGLPNSVGGS